MSNWIRHGHRHRARNKKSKVIPSNITAYQPFSINTVIIILIVITLAIITLTITTILIMIRLRRRRRRRRNQPHYFGYLGNEEVDYLNTLPEEVCGDIIDVGVEKMVYLNTLPLGDESAKKNSKVDPQMR